MDLVGIHKSFVTIGGVTRPMKITSLPKPAIRSIHQNAKTNQQLGFDEPLFAAEAPKRRGMTDMVRHRYSIQTKTSELAAAKRAQNEYESMSQNRRKIKRMALKGRSSLAKRPGSSSLDLRTSHRSPKMGMVVLKYKKDKKGFQGIGRSPELIPTKAQVHAHESRHLTQPLSSRKGQDRSARLMRANLKPPGIARDQRHMQLKARSEAWADTGQPFTSGHVNASEAPDSTLAYLRARRKMSTGIHGRPDQPIVDTSIGTLPGDTRMEAMLSRFLSTGHARREAGRAKQRARGGIVKSLSRMVWR
jgi:hypothetical protein